MSFNLRNALSNAFVGGGGGGATLAANTFTGAQVISVKGVVSTPPLSLTGTIFSGGSATTTKPQLLIEPTGTTSTNWSTNGTLLGLNAPSGFTGSVLAGQVNAVNVFDFKSSLITLHSGVNRVDIYPTTNALDIRTNAGNAIQLDNARLVLCQWAQSNYYIQSPNGGSGNPNRATGNLNIHSGLSTGSGVGGSLIFGTSAPGASGVSNNAIVNRLTIDTHGVFHVENATTVPSASPGSGGYLYVEGGALKYRSAGGTTTTVAPN